jgi:hypothetical protein
MILEGMNSKWADVLSVQPPVAMEWRVLELQMEQTGCTCYKVAVGVVNKLTKTTRYVSSDWWLCGA